MGVYFFVGVVPPLDAGDFRGENGPMKLPFGNNEARVYKTTEAMGAAAAAETAGLIVDAVERRGRARLIVATGNSQEAFICSLMSRDDLPWEKVEAFHMDEYVGIGDDHPASFRRWIREKVAGARSLAAVRYLEGDAGDLSSEIRRYTALLQEGPIDAAFVGFGENGHIAFNDPHVADFQDPEMIKIVELDEACRNQQVGEGHFPSLNAVPRTAVTLTCPALFRARHWICCVPERRKAEAVRRAFQDPVSEACPATLARTHPSAQLFLDRDSAALLGGD